NARSRALGQFAMAGDKVGVQMRLNDMFDLPVIASGYIKVDINIPLGVDYRCNALRPNHVGCVGQTAQIETLNLHRFHTDSLEDFVSLSFEHCGTRSLPRLAQTSRCEVCGFLEPPKDRRPPKI